VLKNELCVVLFRKETASAYTGLVEAILRQLEEARQTSKPFHMVESQEDLAHLPSAKLFVLILDVDTKAHTVSKQPDADRDLHVATVKVIKSLGGKCDL
jgi:hypothetical protein